MEVNCAGCAGCCLDWRPLLETDADEHSRSRGRIRDEGDAVARDPVDDDPSFVPLTRDEVRGFLERGMGAALTPRFWRARSEREAVEVDGRPIAAIADRPAFFVGLRKPPKPVAPFGRERPTWLPACVFLDPATLQCRIHDGDLFPDECGAYPTYNLALDRETECERVESIFGGERLLEEDLDDADEDVLDGLLLGTAAIGEKLFCHPDPDDLEGTIERLAADELTVEDRAETIAVAAASSPGTLAISDHHYERAVASAVESSAAAPSSLDSDDAGDGSTQSDTGERSAPQADGSWVAGAIDAWHRRHANAGGETPPPTIAATIEERRGAPETPGWDDLEAE
ncbi:YkgJ family cysteine cluster protein [Natrarchaeobius oligotrophus]|uniref:YkgJ family cysteine cluster protein n=1 Tax=Natrarchaeobius chitinivorans TaxID=1679083 RepID=A0A3N6PIQ7_NATCH|nr:YkgJ family cysteine cluster protein [Natrarchaeobius chitinivorans]RQH00810.1 YkgJ family cysteine cluster protein [Natrarchaeobius chitinivorans]